MALDDVEHVKAHALIYRMRKSILGRYEGPLDQRDTDTGLAAGAWLDDTEPPESAYQATLDWMLEGVSSAPEA